MFKIYNFFYSLILTFYSIIKIYLITEKNSKKDKVLFFYFPVNIYQSNIYDLIFVVNSDEINIMFNIWTLDKASLIKND